MVAKYGSVSISKLHILLINNIIVTMDHGSSRLRRRARRAAARAAANAAFRETVADGADTAEKAVQKDTVSNNDDLSNLLVILTYQLSKLVPVMCDHQMF